ncbi:hypothetical protein AK812_SmicGene32410 [Symbiodinium microadriaticum]|uniref:Uncharacterized protein n=1 Tax=Symbiodinium microadriaticum TaxID=2951 RepID=A0A1Q9CU94_SYMMI|nr:hypothetical protein AK812_SmicGene32410 [Symbiodinium microadriaticum]
MCSKTCWAWPSPIVEGPQRRRIPQDRYKDNFVVYHHRDSPSAVLTATVTILSGWRCRRCQMRCKPSKADEMKQVPPPNRWVTSQPVVTPSSSPITLRPDMRIEEVIRILLRSNAVCVGDAPDGVFFVKVTIYWAKALGRGHHLEGGCRFGMNYFEINGFQLEAYVDLGDLANEELTPVNPVPLPVGRLPPRCRAGWTARATAEAEGCDFDLAPSAEASGAGSAAKGHLVDRIAPKPKLQLSAKFGEGFRSYGQSVEEASPTAVASDEEMQLLEPSPTAETEGPGAALFGGDGSCPASAVGGDRDRAKRKRKEERKEAKRAEKARRKAEEEQRLLQEEEEKKRRRREAAKARAEHKRSLELARANRPIVMVQDMTLEELRRLNQE